MRALVLAAGLLVLALVAACSSPTLCGAANCGTCCKSDGTCATAVSTQECGAAGNMCAPCQAGFSCSGGACIRGSGGGAGGGSAGGTGGGSGGSGGSGGATGGGGGSSGGGTGGAGGGGTPINCPGGPLPAVFPIDFPPSCSSPSPCNGGALSGTFHYTSACIGQNELTAFKTGLEMFCGAGTVNIYGLDGGMQGSAFFSQGQVCRTVQGAVTVSATVGGTLCPMFCSNLNMGIGAAGYTGSCFTDAGVCDCTATRAISLTNNAVAYTTTANTLTLSTTGQTFETCLDGVTLTTRELDAGSGGVMAHEFGVATLTHQ